MNYERELTTINVLNRKYIQFCSVVVDTRKFNLYEFIFKWKVECEHEIGTILQLNFFFFQF